jgi:hypothetical protein
MRDLTDDRTTIRVKRMGHLDVEPFVKASKRRLTGNDTEVYAEWEENLRDPHWQPFKRVETGNIVKVCYLCHRDSFSSSISHLISLVSGEW